QEASNSPHSGLRSVCGLPSRQLIYRFLPRDLKNRLGSREGASEVKRRTFFRGINQALVCCQNPPKLETPMFGVNEDLKVD
nr:putative LOV domain-containing protein [Tanacetum cinerariifolium]